MAEEEDVELELIREKNSSKIFWMHFGALVRKRFLYFKRDLKSLLCEILLPILIVWIGLAVTRIQFIKLQSRIEFTPGIWELPTNEIWVNTGFDSFTDKIPTRDTKVVKKTPQTSSEFDTFMKANRDPNRLMAIAAEAVDNTNKFYNYNLFLNSTAPDTIHVGLVYADNAILKLATGDDQAYIKVGVQPLPLTKNTQRFEGFVDAFIAAFFIAIAYAFIPSSLIMFLVTERENNAKHQQIVSGVSLTAYWFSNLLVDFVKYLIPALFTYFAILAYDIDAFLLGQNHGAILILGVLVGPALIGFTYLTSFMFKGPSSAQIFTFIFSLFTGFILMIVTLVTRVIESTRKPSINGFEWIFRLFPLFNYCFGLYTMGAASFWEGIFKLGSRPTTYSEYGVTKEIISLIVMLVVYFVLIFVIEYRKGKVNPDKSYD